MADVQRDPELLRAHARTASGLAEAAAAAVRGWEEHELPPAEAADLDRLVTAVGHAVAELAEASAVLDAAAAVDGVDVELRARMRRALAP
ncbi:hypothetical protein ACQEVB_11490 [Pseudonocardia sp. CA-107938]|uniref:hypothetical protein n=1 Tax=Pseudonocardia sp. CA-107938 TaxID=3240021 RepID=UPI003D93D940